SGLGQSVGGCTRAAMVELNCETDFVSRNELLRKLAANIAHTAAFLAEPVTNESRPFCSYQIADFSEAPLLSDGQAEPSKASETINDHIRNNVSKIGEKRVLRRAIALVRETAIPKCGFRVAAYVHGSLSGDFQVGQIGTLVDICL